MLELIDRDAGGRICKWNVGKRIIETPNIAIVIDSRKQVVPPEWMEKTLKTDIIITNAYIIKKTDGLRQEIEHKGLHKFFNFNGIIMCDSGAYQEMYGQKIDLTNKEIIKFQEKIKPDIGTFLDVPSSDLKYNEAKKTVNETIKRAKECKKLTKNSKLLWAGPIQGGAYLDIVAKCAKQIKKLNFDTYPIGSIVPKMIRYDFKTVCEQIMTARLILPPNKPLHAFGLGLPAFMSLAVAIGADLFDSAMYSLAARRGAYLTTRGTIQLKEIKEFPCNCPACSSTDVVKLKNSSHEQIEKFLTLHNLYVTLREIKTIRQAIRQERLWELVFQRCRAHPKLLEALSFVLNKFGKHLIPYEKISKKSALFYLGRDTENRPEVLRSAEWKKRVTGKKTKHKFFGPVPVGLKDTYPFSQSVIFGKQKYPKISPIVQIRSIINYQYEKGASKKFKGVRVDTSRKTKRLRRVWKGKELLGTVRSHDGLFVPTKKGAQLLGKYMKKVYVNDKEVAGFISIGRSLFAKFISRADNIFPGEEVAIYYKKKLLATGTAILNKQEMLSFKRGVAVKVR